MCARAKLILNYLPLPDLPTNLKSLNLATWFLKVAVAFLRSAALFSSLPAVNMTLVPSRTSLRESTLNGTGSVLLQRQCDGRIVQTKFGLLVRTSSPGYSARTSENVLSPRKGLVGSTGWWLPFSVGVGAVGGEAITIGIGGLLLEVGATSSLGRKRRKVKFLKAANSNACNQLPAEEFVFVCGKAQSLSTHSDHNASRKQTAHSNVHSVYLYTVYSAYTASARHAVVWQLCACCVLVRTQTYAVQILKWICCWLSTRSGVF